MLNRYQLTDSKVQLNVNKVNNGKSSSIARLYQRKCKSDGKPMTDRLLQRDKFGGYP